MGAVCIGEECGGGDVSGGGWGGGLWHVPEWGRVLKRLMKKNPGQRCLRVLEKKNIQTGCPERERNDRAVDSEERKDVGGLLKGKKNPARSLAEKNAIGMMKVLWTEESFAKIKGGCGRNLERKVPDRSNAERKNMFG
jgi:hypothetical protein